MPVTNLCHASNTAHPPSSRPCGLTERAELPVGLERPGARIGRMIIQTGSFNKRRRCTMPLFDAKNKSQARIIQFSSVCSHPLQLATLQRELSIERNSHPQECRSRSILTAPSRGKRPGGDGFLSRTANFAPLTKRPKKPL